MDAKYNLKGYFVYGFTKEGNDFAWYWLEFKTVLRYFLYKDRLIIEKIVNESETENYKRLANKI